MSCTAANVGHLRPCSMQMTAIMPKRRGLTLQTGVLAANLVDGCRCSGGLSSKPGPALPISMRASYYLTKGCSRRDLRKEWYDRTRR